jgi:hypothetical protein
VAAAEEEEEAAPNKKQEKVAEAEAEEYRLPPEKE